MTITEALTQPDDEHNNLQAPLGRSDPHPLPRTRQWVEDYRRHEADTKPVESEPTIPLNEAGCPDLQALVRQYSGYDKITPELWAAWDRATAEARRRTGLNPPRFWANHPECT
jgi:hypothetical protein